MRSRRRIRRWSNSASTIGRVRVAASCDSGLQFESVPSIENANRRKPRILAGRRKRDTVKYRAKGTGDGLTLLTIERSRQRRTDEGETGSDLSLTQEVGTLTETPTSSRYVTGGHAFAYFCKLCRAEMPFEQRESHNRAIHPDLLERQQRASLRTKHANRHHRGRGLRRRFLPRAVCPRHDSWNSCPSLVHSRDLSSHVCRLLRSISLCRENEAHLFRGRRGYSRSMWDLLRKDWRTGATIPFRLCAPRGIQTFSHFFLDSADMSKRNPVVRNPRGHFPFLTWFRRLGVAAVCGMGRALRFLGGPWPSPLGEGSGCLAGFARSGSAAPSMSEPAG